MAESEVVLHRIVGIELAQRRGDLLGCCPGGRPTIGESEIATDAMDVRIDGNQERGGRDRPKPEVYAIGRSDHPSRVEEEPLARASRAGVAHQVAQGPAGGVPSKGIGKTGHALPEIASAFQIKTCKRLSQGSVPSEQVSRVPEHDRQVLGTIDAMNEAPEEPAELVIVGLHDRRGGCGPQGSEPSIDASSRGDGVSKCEAGSDETYDFLVARLPVTVKEVDGISTAGGLRITAREKGIESFADTIHRTDVLAILPCELQ